MADRNPEVIACASGPSAATCRGSRRWGASHAERGWGRRDRVLDTWSPDAFPRWWRSER